MRQHLISKGITVDRILRNPSPALLYEEGLRREVGTAISSTGALIALSGSKTGRSPRDKRIVDNDATRDQVWWSDVNIPLDEHIFDINRARAIDYLNTRSHLFVIDGFAGADHRHRLRVRVICERAYHALFMHNMLVRPTREELAAFGEPDLTIINAGRFPANIHTEGMTSKTSIDISFERGELVILGTEYAGEMKKGVFTIMNHLMPAKEILSMHCSANQGEGGDVTLFFGLSGTGKTTLSADPRRRLIGDDEHCWSDEGVFNIEGGCYAKTVDLSPSAEPEIYGAIRFGSVLENVVYADESRIVDYADVSITQNTRCSYPIDFIPNAVVPSIGGHPSNVVFLACDAFSILPPVSRLTPAQAMYHFVSGYTAKVGGTEVGVTQPEATFSPCFGSPFLVRHPAVYARMLADRLARHDATAWLVNTGWIGGPSGVGSRISIAHTRAIVDAIHDGSLIASPTVRDEIFGLEVPTRCNGVPDEVLQPWLSWPNRADYDRAAGQLAAMFQKNFASYSNDPSDAIAAAGPAGGTAPNHPFASG